MRLKYFLLILTLTFTAPAFYAFGPADAESVERRTPMSLKVSFYNVENLFDTIDDPGKNDEEFTPGGDLHWNSERYYDKLDHLAKVISSMHSGYGPDVIGLCEIENRSVLNDLVNHELLKKKNYQVVHTESPDKRGIDVALLVVPGVRVNDFQADNVNLPDTSEKTRNILWVNLEMLNKENFWVGVCHFPSRSGGEEISKPKRAAAAATVKQFTNALDKKKKKWFIMGDFNDEPTDSSMFAIIKGRSAPEGKDPVNLMLPLKGQGVGSYKYKDQWNMLDQFVVSQKLYTVSKGWRYSQGSVSIFSQDWMLEKEGKFAGNPWRTYAGKKYLGGYSDHLPIQMTLIF